MDFRLASILALLVIAPTGCQEDLGLCGSEDAGRQMMCYMSEQKPFGKGSDQIHFLYVSTKAFPRLPDVFASILESVESDGMYLAVGGTDPSAAELLVASLSNVKRRYDGLYVQLFLPLSKQSEDIRGAFETLGADVDFFDVTFMVRDGTDD